MEVENIRSTIKNTLKTYQKLGIKISHVQLFLEFTKTEKKLSLT